MFLWLLFMFMGDEPKEAQIQSVADAYLKAVEQMDWARMQALLADDAIFEDPTSEVFGEPWRYVGPEAIVDFYRDAAVDTLATSYRIVRQFATGTHVVYEIEGSGHVKASLIGHPDKELKDTVNLVTVITVQDGKVIRHRDYVDYADMMQKLAQHKKNFDAEVQSSQ